MKKTLLALAIAASAQLSAFAQGYTFTKSTGTYANLVSPTVVSASGWDNETYDIKIGFNFTIDGFTADSVHVDTYGDIFFTSPSNPVAKAIIAYESDMVDRAITGSPSQVSYQLTGTAGSRIFKMEFKNAGFNGQSGPIANEFTNFQVWLYEGSNKIEMHYGPVTVSVGLSTFFSPGSSHGIVTNIDQTTGSATGVFLSGAPANPTMANVVVPFSLPVQFWIWPALSGVATNSSIFAFTPSSTTGVAKNLENTNVSVYPNPANDVVKIAGLTKGNVTVKIHDALGKVVLTNEMAAANNASINVSTLPKGAYYMEIVSEEGRMGKQFIKQ